MESEQRTNVRLKVRLSTPVRDDGGAVVHSPSPLVCGRSRWAQTEPERPSSGPRAAAAEMKTLDQGALYRVTPAAGSDRAACVGRGVEVQPGWME